MIKVALMNVQVGNNLIRVHGMAAERQIRGGIGDNSKIIFVISQRKHML